MTEEKVSPLTTTEYNFSFSQFSNFEELETLPFRE